MKKKVTIENEAGVMSALKDAKRVEGVLYVDKVTGQLTFKGYNRLPKGMRTPDRVVCHLEHGWLKESPRRYKFYSSVKKVLGSVTVVSVMQRELGCAEMALYEE